MKNIRSMFVLVLALTSHVVLGATCGPVDPSEDFQISFSINSAQLNETLFGEQQTGNNNPQIPIWTDDPAVRDGSDGSPFVRDPDKIAQNGSYSVQLFYTNGQGNIPGEIDYYLGDINGANFTFVGTYPADLKGIHPNKVMLEGNVDDLECSTGVTPPPIYSPEPKYEYGVTTCSSETCSIPLSGYSLTPIVILAPTISNENPDQDGPSTLAITNVDTSGVTFTQRDALSNYPSTQMAEIAYFIMEPGTTQIGGQDIVAGYLNTTKFKAKGGGGNTAPNRQIDVVTYSTFNGGQLDDAPVVLHQLQTQNNSSQWMTSGKLSSSNYNNYDESIETRLFIELSATGDKSTTYIDERIGFIATSQSSLLMDGGNSLKFGVETSNRQSGGDPMTDGCGLLFDTGLDAPTGLIVKKRSRRGGDGGWARRCQLNDSGDNAGTFSAVIDEDFTNRSHTREELGYFAFEEPVTELPDVCDVFPSAAQTWDSNVDENINLDNNSSIEGAFLSQGKRYVGFEVLSGNNITQACDGTECFGDSELKIDKLTLEDFKPTDSGLENVNLWDTDEVYAGDNSFGTLRVGKGTVTFNSGTYWVKELDINNGGRIIVPDGQEVTLHLQYVAIGGLDANRKSFLGSQGSGKFVVFIHDLPDSGTNFYLDGEFKGLLYSEIGVVFNNNFVVNGSVTAKSISMNTAARIVFDENNCLEPSPGNYRIELTPSSDIALTCEVIPLTATVYRDGIVDSSYSGTVTLYDADGGAIDSESSSNGVANFDLSTEVPNQAQTRTALYVQAQVGGETYQSDSTGDFQFVPYRFNVDAQYVIAGREKNVAANVLACDSDNSPTDIGYSGTPEITHIIDEPSNGFGSVSYDLPKFIDGKSSANLTFDETGIAIVTLTDDAFPCVDLESCPVEGVDTLSGSFHVYSRPWTLAICGTHLRGGTSNAGERFVASGIPFDAEVRPIKWAGSDIEQEDPSVAIETSGYCNDSGLIVKNFSFSDAESVPVAISRDSAEMTPSGGTPGDFNDQEKDHDDVNANYIYDFTDFIWTEVGSIRLTSLADLTGGYYGMGINVGYRDVGRFYPAYFSVEDGLWEAKANQGDIAYLGQNFVAWNLKVYPRNALGNRVSNYFDFDSAYKANFPGLQDVDGYAARITGWDSNPKQYWGEDDIYDASVWAPGFPLTFERLDYLGSTTRPDGPFNTDDVASIETKLELMIEGSDPVSFELNEPINETQFSDSKQLTTAQQPPARYGRMVMSDVGGLLNADIPIPLRVEYWDGAWKVNSDDDASEFISKSTYLCFQGNNSGATLNGSDSAKTVEVGNKPTTTDLSAINNGTAVSVRVWMKMDSSIPGKVDSNDGDISCASDDLDQPWLMYDWRGLGDEHPSSLITFGIYRGNDRIIFRGEPGLTGQ